MKCEHCGAVIDEACNFCPVCGNKIEKKEPNNQATPENTNPKKGFSNFLNFNKNRKDPIKENSDDKEKINERAMGEGLNSGDTPLEDNLDNNDISANENYSNGDNLSNDEVIKENLENNKNPNQKINEEENIDEDFFRPDPFDRMDKENRRYENLGGKSSPYNQRSVIEEVQAKVYRNTSKKKDDEDYYIKDYKNLIQNENLEERLDKLIGDGEGDLSSMTVSYGIRKIQDRNKKISRENITADDGDQILRNANPKEKSPAVRPVDKKADQTDKEIDPNKKKYLTSRNVLLGLIGVLIAVILGVLYIKNNKADDITIPLSDYITLTYEGEDGAAVPKAMIDTEKLIAAYGNEIKYISRDNNKDSYESAAQEFAADLQNNVVFQYSKDSGLSNGDEITVMANLDNIKISDKYNVLMSNASKAVIIDGIANSEFTDPFSFINVKFEGKSPDITLTASLTDDAPEFMHTIDIIPAKSNGIQEGEEVAVSLNFDAEELKNAYNVSLSPTSKNFTASTGEGEKEEEKEEATESDSDFIKTTAHLADAEMGELKHKAGELIKQTILYKNIINVDKIDYLGSFTGFKEDGSGDIKNKVYLIYEVTTSEKLPDSNFGSSFKYYTFVEYQNVKKAKDDSGKFYTGGPITTDNQIFHKFFVESDYKYYQIEYQGFGFIEKALSNVNAGLEGLSVTEDNKTNITKHFATSDGVVGEYEADGRRLSLKEDGSLVYQIDKAVHIGSYSANGNEISATIKGVNVDTPVILNFDGGLLKAESQGEFEAISFSKIENF